MKTALWIFLFFTSLSVFANEYIFNLVDGKTAVINTNTDSSLHKLVRFIEVDGADHIIIEQALTLTLSENGSEGDTVPLNDYIQTHPNEITEQIRYLILVMLKFESREHLTDKWFEMGRSIITPKEYYDTSDIVNPKIIKILKGIKYSLHNLRTTFQITRNNVGGLQRIPVIDLEQQPCCSKSLKE